MQLITLVSCLNVFAQNVQQERTKKRGEVEFNYRPRGLAFGNLSERRYASSGDFQYNNQIDVGVHLVRNDRFGYFGKLGVNFIKVKYGKFNDYLNIGTAKVGMTSSISGQASIFSLQPGIGISYTLFRHKRFSLYVQGTFLFDLPIKQRFDGVREYVTSVSESGHPAGYAEENYTEGWKRAREGVLFGFLNELKGFYHISEKFSIGIGGAFYVGQTLIMPVKKPGSIFNKEAVKGGNLSSHLQFRFDINFNCSYRKAPGPVSQFG